MTLLGHFTLGDRDNGKVELHGDTLTIGKSRYRQQDRNVSLPLEIPG